MPAGTSQDAELQLAIRRTMWEKVGVVRDERGLTAALDELEALAESHPHIAGEARNILSMGRLVTATALARRESRGGHYRSDYPQPDPDWQRRIYVTAAPDGSAVLDEAPSVAVAL
jgi:L-aspartate oxidase